LIKIVSDAEQRITTASVAASLVLKGVRAVNVQSPFNGIVQ